MSSTQVATVQGLSGTGSLRLGAAFIQRYFPGTKVLISSPTWGKYSRDNFFNEEDLLYHSLYVACISVVCFCSYVYVGCLQETTKISSMMPMCHGRNIAILTLRLSAWILKA